MRENVKLVNRLARLARAERRRAGGLSTPLSGNLLEAANAVANSLLSAERRSEGAFLAFGVRRGRTPEDLCRIAAEKRRAGELPKAIKPKGWLPE